MKCATVASIVGARPQFIKAAPLQSAFSKSRRVRSVLVHTGQHHDANMSDIFFNELNIEKPEHHLGISGGTHGQMTGRMLEAIEKVLMQDAPDAVLVYGDTNSTLAGALAAVKLHLPVFHVESGLRSFNRRMPEEVNRVATDHLSELLFCPTESAVENLRREGVQRGVHLVGDVMYDATLAARERAMKLSDAHRTISVNPRGYVLCTLHRAENTDNSDRLGELLEYVRRQAGNLDVVLPLHPRTRKIWAEACIDMEGITLLDPVGYLEMQRLIAECAFVCTDSGGLQKEAYFHRKPCITLRDETEWVETLDAGWNRLWRQEDWVKPRTEISQYGDGLASDRIVAAIENWFAGQRSPG